MQLASRKPKADVARSVPVPPRRTDAHSINVKPVSRFDPTYSGTSPDLESVDHLLQLLGGDANGAVHGNAGTGEERGEQVALIAFGTGQESSRVDGSAAFARDDEGKVFAGLLVPVLETGET